MGNKLSHAVRRAWKEFGRRFVSATLIASMLAPNAVTLAAYGADYINNMPRYVDFTQPKALTLDELGIDAATPSNTNTITAPETGHPAAEEVATPSEIREPELFYDDSADEPGGILVQFDEDRNIRTYQQGEGQYVTVVGGYSGLYRDSDGAIRTVDNQMVSTGKNYAQADEGGEDVFEDVDLINDLGTEPIYPADKATPSNAPRYRSAGRATASNAYYNREGRLEVYIPENMGGGNGYTITRGMTPLRSSRRAGTIPGA